MSPFERIADYTSTLEIPASEEVLLLGVFAATLYAFDFIRQHWRNPRVAESLAQRPTNLRTARADQTFKRIAPCLYFSIAMTLTLMFLDQASTVFTSSSNPNSAFERYNVAAWTARVVLIAAWAPTISVWLFNFPRRFVHPLVRDGGGSLPYALRRAAGLFRR